MRTRRKNNRSGAILIVALVAVAIFSSLSVTNIRSVLQHRQSVKSERDLIQVQLLCNAGCDRAASKLASEPDYQGETWLELKEPSNGSTMKVIIEIQLKEGQKLARVQASIEGRDHQPEKISRSKLISLRESP